MTFGIRNQQDFAAGVIYIVAGGSFAAGALNYNMGDAARMGPGYFPFWVGVLLAAIGMTTLTLSLRPSAAVEKLKKPQLGTLVWVLGAVVLFGLLLQPMGLVFSLAVLVIVSSMASHEFSWRGAIANAVVLILFSVFVFIKGINLQIQMWPTFLTA